MKQAALLHAPDGDSAGEWMELSSPTFKGNKGTSAPEIRVFAALREVRASALAPLNPRHSAALAERSFDATAEARDEPSRVDDEKAASTADPRGPASARSSFGGFGTPAAPTRASLAAVAGSADVAEGPGSAAAGEASDETLHLFSLAVDVRSFKSTRRMPFPTASVVVKLSLPSALLDAVELGGRPPSAVAVPVRTNPPASVARASEVTLGNGAGRVDFGAGVMRLAAALAKAPRCVAEVWHKDAYVADQLLGTATVSLAPLLREPVLDGYAPVMADVSAKEEGDVSTRPRSAATHESDAIKVGELRVVLSLAEKGPLPMWATKAAAGAERTLATGPGRDAADPRDVVPGSSPAPRPRAGAPSAVVKASTLRASMERAAAVSAGRERQLDEAMASKEAAAVTHAAVASAYFGEPSASETAEMAEAKMAEKMRARRVLAEHAENVANASASVGDSVKSETLREGREYAAAWELEVWKQAQEAKWTASMRARESERMEALEGEWRRREAQRETEHRRASSDAAALEKRLSASLASVEERERRLVAAEESLSVRREAERREMAQRMSEAQHAVRRLQQECEHQLEMEKGRTADVERQKEALERRVEEADARAAAVEKAFHGYKKQHLESSEATLHAEIAKLQQKTADAEQKERDATSSRDRFKTQIQKMAKQVVALERERTYLRAALANVGGGNGEGEFARGVPMRGRAPKPAPSGADFVSELLASGEALAETGDGFLADFRESIAALEEEARRAPGGEISGLSPVDADDAKAPRSPAARTAPARHAEPSPRSPALEQLKERQKRGKARQLSREFGDAKGSGAGPGAGAGAGAGPPASSGARASPAKPPRSPARSPGRPGRGDGLADAPASWSMESETGLKALFASAKDYEEEETAKREAAASKAAMEAAVRAIEETGAGACGGEGGGAAAAPASPARTSGKPPRSPKKSPKPVTAASLAEKRAQEKEVRRLVAERAELMGTGAYSSADRVIAIIDEKIADLTSAVAGG